MVKSAVDPRAETLHWMFLQEAAGAQVTIVDDETLQWTAGYPWTPEVEAFFRTHEPIVRHILASIPTVVM